jgi:hypothetical protein
METILVKIFATALALSQVTTTPDTISAAIGAPRRSSDGCVKDSAGLAQRTLIPAETGGGHVD